ncbi:MAG: stage III sporulation protein AF [Schaedlerella sp.]|nr:stage III sporulation protein AF [Schaedlerella sp.]
MLDWLYEWIKNLAFYMILISIVFKVLPGNQYGKYIQFFSGIVLILLVFMPVIRLAGKEEKITELYQNNEYEQQKKEIERMEKYFTEAELIDFLPEEYLQEEENVNEIEIAPVVIGEE